MNALRLPLLGAALLLSTLLPASAFAQSRTIAPGQTQTGRLQTGDATTSDGSFTHLYVYTGAQGDELDITLTSSDFDTYLGWGRIVGSNFESVSSNDDADGGTNSRIDATVGSGTFAVQVTSFSPGVTGSYSLTVTRRGGSGDDSDIRMIGVGTVSGRLVASDPTLGDGSHYHLYVYTARAGERLTITMRSTEVDSYLSGGIFDGDELEISETDDDSAGGSDARIEAQFSQAGVYVIRANTFGEGETGSYTLTVESNLAPQASGGGLGGGGGAGGGGTAATINPGSQISGRLTSSSPQLDDDSYYQPYRYQARAGERLRITMNSSDFDTFLFLGRVDGNSFESVDTDDDDGDGTNSYIEIQVEEAGLYEIRANSYAAEETGAFTLLLESDATSSGATIALGQTVSGQLMASDPILTDNSHYKLYTYYGTPGEQVLVTMRSGAFDTYLAGGRMVGGSFVQDISDDDGAGGTDSQLLAEIGTGGSFVIRANSLRGGETGNFTLTVQPVGAARPTNPIPAGALTVASGSQISGTLATSDTRAPDDSFYDQYIYQGNPGDRIQITLSSSDFDSYLRWGQLNGDRFIEEETDDDSAGNLNSRLEVTVGGSGLYAIRANSFSAGATGAYTLRVESIASAGAVVEGAAGKWEFAYLPSTDQSYQRLGSRMQSWRILETVTNELSNRNYALPNPIEVKIDECGMINAFYSPRDVEITFCYELIDMLAASFAEVPGNPDAWSQEEVEAIEGAFRFIMMHEVGHALVDQLDLGITGREEDAVDQLAALIMIQSGDKGAAGAYRGVQAIQPDDNSFEEWEFAGEHSLGPQRKYNVLCWIYGSDPVNWASIVEDGLLPEDRAVRCPGEFDRLQKAWTRLLAAG